MRNVVFLHLSDPGIFRCHMVLSIEKNFTPERRNLFTVFIKPWFGKAIPSWFVFRSLET